MKRISTAILAALFVFALFAQAHADGTIQWDTAGDSNLPCAYGAHWIILAPAEYIETATLSVDGNSYPMTRQADGSFTADSGAVALAPTAFATYTGEASVYDHLQITGCTTPVPSGGGGGDGGGGSVPAPSPPTTPTPVTVGHQSIVICQNWTWAKAGHVKLVRFSRSGVSIYRCVSPR